MVAVSILIMSRIHPCQFALLTPNVNAFPVIINEDTGIDLMNPPTSIGVPFLKGKAENLTPATPSVFANERQ